MDEWSKKEDISRYERLYKSRFLTSIHNWLYDYKYRLKLFF